MAVALPEGTEIGGFVLADVIGRGGFGITYRARERRSQQTYAIKEYMPEDFALRDPRGTVTAQPGRGDTYERGLRAFLIEANTLKELPRRDGLVKVRGAFERSGTAYCVMEYIEGDSLDRMSQRMARRVGHTPPDLVADLAASVCWALDALHEKGVIHRDVKPANIMIRRSGEPVLIDFGAARQLSRRGKSDAIFTRRYAAIEQFPPELTGFGRSFEEGPWSDIYSLSVLLYELVTLRSPPDALQRAESLFAAAGDPYVPVQHALAGSGREGAYAEGLLEAIDTGCELMPSARPRTVRAFAAGFRALPLVPSPPVDVDPRGPSRPSGLSRDPLPTTAPEARAGRGMLVLLGGLAAVGAGLVYIYFAMPEVLLP